MDAGAFVDWPAFVVKTEAPTGSTDVDSKLAEIRVTFSKEMADGSCSWVTLNKEAFAEIVVKIHYDKDRRTCDRPGQARARQALRRLPDLAEIHQLSRHEGDVRRCPTC